MRSAPSVKAFILASLFLSFASSLFALEGEKAFSVAVENYNNASYRNARYCFRKALESGLEEDKAKVAKYAVRVLDEFKTPLGEIEDLEARFKAHPEEKGDARTLSSMHYSFANTLMRKEFYMALVEPHLKRALELEPDNTFLSYTLAAAYYAAMRYAKCVEACEKALSLDPKLPLVYRLAGDASVALGDFDKAKKFYSDFIRVNKEDAPRSPSAETAAVERILKALPETYKDIDALIKSGDSDGAELILKKRLSLNRSDYVAMTHLANIYLDRGDRKTALKLLKAAIEIAPDYPIAHLFLGRFYYLSRKPDEAASEFKTFKVKMRLLPKMDDETKKIYVNNLHYLSEVYFSMKEYGEAKRQIDEALKVEPKDQTALYNLGVYYYVAEHNRAGAYNSFKKVIDIDSTADTAASARYAIEFIRNNPDSRFAPDFSFLRKER
jgi:tetratricopeptide (TPR) repeat protein